MQQYDAALKSVLTSGPAGFLSRLMGVEMAGFLNAELPQVRTRRPDLLGQARDGTLIHVELQSTNVAEMEWRMSEYFFALRRQFQRCPRQMVLYVGEAPMRVESGIVDLSLKFEYQLVDIRELDGEPLLESASE